MSGSKNTVRLHRVLRAPAERVYRAFLEAGDERVMRADAIADSAAGGDVAGAPDLTATAPRRPIDEHLSNRGRGAISRRVLHR